MSHNAKSVSSKSWQFGDGITQVDPSSCGSKSPAQAVIVPSGSTAVQLALTVVQSTHKSSSPKKWIPGVHMSHRVMSLSSKSLQLAEGWTHDWPPIYGSSVPVQLVMSPLASTPVQSVSTSQQSLHKSSVPSQKNVGSHWSHSVKLVSSRSVQSGDSMTQVVPWNYGT